MATRIDYEKSISTGRLSWKRDAEGKLDLIFNYFFWGLAATFLVVFPVYFSIKEIRAGTFGEISSFFYFGFFAIGLIAFYGVFVIGKLRRVTGRDPETNRIVVTQLLKRDFDKINENATGTKILTIKKPLGLFSFGQKVTVLFHNEDILINILTIGRYDIKSIFHAWSNDDRVKSLIKEFKEEIGKNSERPTT